MEVVLHWKNGDRQFIRLDTTRVKGQPDRRIVYRVGEAREGDYEPSTHVAFALNEFAFLYQHRTVYTEA